MSNLLYLLIRLVLWCAGLFVSLFPTILEIKAPSLWPSVFAWQANSKGLFRDLMFVIVPTVSLSLSTIIDFMINHFAKSKEFFQQGAILGLILNIIALCSGFVGFLRLPGTHKPIAVDQFVVFYWTIIFAVSISLVTEVMMALVVRTRP